jgi:hypothetical protein
MTCFVVQKIDETIRAIRKGKLLLSIPMRSRDEIIQLIVSESLNSEAMKLTEKMLKFAGK